MHFPGWSGNKVVMYRSLAWRHLIVTLLLSSCAGIVACVPVQAVHRGKHVAADRTWSVAIDGRTVTYRGIITADGVQHVEAWLDRYPEVRTLEIESQGGDTNAGMRLGDQVLARGLDVDVIGSLCASSCANYVFTSGDRKSIAPGAKVIWHGSPLRPEGIPVINEVIHADGSVDHELLSGERLMAYLQQPEIASMIERDRDLNRTFFEKRGVDGRVTTYGQEIGCGCNWTFNVADMYLLGIKNVVAEDGYPSPSSDGPPLVTLKLEANFRRSKIGRN